MGTWEALTTFAICANAAAGSNARGRPRWVAAIYDFIPTSK